MFMFLTGDATTSAFLKFIRSLSWAKIFPAVVALAICMLGVKIATTIFNKGISKSRIDPTLQPTIRTAFRVLMMLLAVLIASVVASVLLSVLTRRDEKRGEGGREYPFAPFLSVGYAISLFFGATLINAYLSLLF